MVVRLVVQGIEVRRRWNNEASSFIRMLNQIHDLPYLFSSRFLRCQSFV